MPAASDGPSAGLPETGLPRTFRPLGVRLAGWFFGGLLVVVCAGMWIGLGEELRGAFALRQQLTLLGLLVGLLACLHALMRCRVDADADGITIVNGYRTRRLQWPQIVDVHLPPGAPWATFDIADGTTVGALAIQGTDGDRARRDVLDLRALIADTRPAT